MKIRLAASRDGLVGSLKARGPHGSDVSTTPIPAGPRAPLIHQNDALITTNLEEPVSAFGRGLDANSVKNDLAAIAISETAEMEVLYGWHDGTRFSDFEPMDDYQVFPGFYFAPLSEVTENYREFLKSDRWHVGWLPVFANGGGDFYVLDTESGGSVRHFRIDEDEHPVEYASLDAFISTIAAAIKRKIIYADADDYLEMNDRLFGDLARRMNPSVSWWQD